MELLANIQFQDITRQQIEQVISYLSDLDKYIEHLKTLNINNRESFRNCADFSLDHIFKTYVMKKQRDIHHETIDDSLNKEALEDVGKTDESNEDKITFF